MRLQWRTFDGLAPKSDPRNLGEIQAQVAENCDLRSGTLKPLKATSAVTTLPDASRLTIFPYPDTTNWLSWITDVDVVRSPISGDQYDRIYYTGSGSPKVRSRVGAVQSEYTLGIPKPTNAIVAASSAKSTAPFLVTREWHYQWEVHGGQAGDAVLASGTVSEGAMPATTTLRWANDPVVVEITAGKEYVLSRIPDPPSPLPDASWMGEMTFVLWCRGFDASGNYMGDVLPPVSWMANQSNNMRINDVNVRATTEWYYIDIGPATIPAAVADTWATAWYYRQHSLRFRFYFDVSTVHDYTLDRYYVYTFVSAHGEEGPPSDPSNLLSIDMMTNAALSNMDTSVAATYNVANKRIYRTFTSDAGTQYQLVAELAIATATYTDSVADGDLTDVLPSTGWIAPPAALSGLRYHPAGFMVGFTGRDIYVSEVSQFHAWPTANVLTLDFDIVGIEISENTIIVMTEGELYAVAGSAPDQLTPIRTNNRQACVSKRGIAKIGEMVVYPSPDGLVAATPAGASILTENLYLREQWQTLTPSSMVSATHDNLFLGFCSGGKIVLSVESGRMILTTTTENATGAYSDLLTDTLYLIQGAAIRSWATASTYLTARWRSKEMMANAPLWLQSARVDAESYTTQPILRFFAVGSNVQEISFASNVGRKVPVMRQEKRWSFEVETTVPVFEMSVATSMGDLVA